MQINRSNQQHYDARKQSLLQQILSYQKRILQYQKLSKQLNSISSTINETQLSTNIKQSGRLFKNSSSKSLTSNNKSKQSPSASKTKYNNTNNNEQSKKQIKKEKTQRRVSSSKKIKIYQLQKKLSRLNKQHNQKFSEFVAQKREHEVTQETIKQIFQLIEREEIKTQQLIVQNTTLVQTLQKQNSDYLNAKKQLQKVCQRKQVYEFEKQSILTKLQIKKKLISKIKNQIQKGQYDYQQDINNFGYYYQHASDQNQNQNQINDRMERLSDRQTQRTYNYNANHNIANKRKQDGNLSDLSYSKISNSKNYKVQPKKISFQGVQYEIIDSINSLQSSCEMIEVLQNQKQGNRQKNANKQRSKGYKGKMELKQIQRNGINRKKNMFEILKDKIQLLENQNCKLNQQIFQIKRQMLTIQTQTKHHRTNSNLLKSKINKLNQFIARQKANYIKNLQKVQSLRAKLSLQEGKRGQIRGRLGTKVQQEGLVRMLNLTIGKDLQNLRQKNNCLIVYRNMLYGQMVVVKR